jgi:hypothetical protein
MDLDNDLCRLGMLLFDATDDIRQAVEIAERLARHDDEHDVPDWPAMASLLDELSSLRDRLALLPGPAIAGAIEQAERILDDLADRADGQSY